MSASSTVAPEAELPDDPRLMEAVQDYLRRLESGKRPSRQEFLRRYPDLAEPLAQCIDGLQLVHGAVGSSSAVGRIQDATRGAAQPAEELAASPLGDFQIVREIGRGGMGIVYEAIQLSLGRRVALKVLPFAATLDPKYLQRFQNEAQAAAQLHHTNIVPVYAVGRERGVHFYAMQLIEGQSLAALIEEMRHREPLAKSEPTTAGSKATPPTIVDERSAPAVENAIAAGAAVAAGAETVSQLSHELSTQRSAKPGQFFRTAAKLVVQAAEALEHAHQFGIVHRDIKPANLLVDVHGRLWITDFGLAQFHTDAGLTQTGDLVGTLRYMSPEQAGGQRAQIDQRTDIYSLGATLYELATLKPIFPGATRPELLQQIAHDEPRPLRFHAKTIPVDLETIICKAVSKHPADRYSSARELAADLQRFLDDKPILAKRPTLVDRARKWSRRHPSLVAASVLFLLFCVAGLVANNWMIGQEQAKTKAALKNEQQRAAEARRAVDLLVDVAEEELGDQPHLRGVRRRLLETALGYYQDFLEGHASDSTAQAQLEAGKNRVRALLDELATLQGANLLGLANDKNVQDDLKLKEQQRTSITDLYESASQERMTQFREQSSLPREVRRQRFFELAKKQEAGLGAILTPQQMHRLQQIDLRVQGPRAFQDSAAVDVLKLTTDQKRAIRQIKEETLVALFGGPLDKPGPGPGPGGGPGGFSKRSDNERAQVQKLEMERVLALLTPEQVARWQELIGAPFEGRPRTGFFGPGRPFGGPGGPPGGPGGPPFRKKD